jgi:photosystem II stability/assembly factor-like uncharacterized protein
VFSAAGKGNFGAGTAPTTRTVRRSAVLVSAVGALALAGCSSSSKATSSPPATSAPATSAVASAPASSPPMTSAPASSPPVTSPPVAAGSTAAASSVATPSSAPPVASGLAGFHPASVSFVSPSDGFVIGTATCASGTCTTLAKSTDAGHAWSAVGTLPPSLIGSAAAVSKVRFADASDGWAFGPALWSTHDGGHTWKQLPEPAAVSDVEAAGGVVYANVGTTLLRSAVATDSFAAVAGVPAGSGSIFLHGKAVWLQFSAAASGHDYVVSPDGVSWRVVTDPCAAQPDQLGLAGVAPVTTTSVYLLCAGDAGAGSVTKVVLFSTDGGVHGTATTASPARGGDPDGITAASTAVVVVPAQSGASWLYRTADGGHTWSPAIDKGDGGVGFFDVGFTTSTQGVAVYGRPDGSAGVSSQLLITRDAGVTWAAVSF